MMCGRSRSRIRVRPCGRVWISSTVRADDGLSGGRRRHRRRKNCKVEATAVEPTPWAEPLPPRKRSKKWPWIIGAASVAIFLGGLAASSLTQVLASPPAAWDALSGQEQLQFCEMHRDVVNGDAYAWALDAVVLDAWLRGLDSEGKEPDESRYAATVSRDPDGATPALVVHRRHRPDGAVTRRLRQWPRREEPAWWMNATVSSGRGCRPLTRRSGGRSLRSSRIPRPITPST